MRPRGHEATSCTSTMPNMPLQPTVPPPLRSGDPATERQRSALLRRERAEIPEHGASNLMLRRSRTPLSYMTAGRDEMPILLSASSWPW